VLLSRSNGTGEFMPAFDVPEQVRFTCSECGDCCRGVQVLLEEDERQALAARDWSGLASDLEGAATTVVLTEGPLKGRHRLAHRADGSCVYLGARNQCRLHEHFGPEAKPRTCRMYPFAFRPMGERVAVDVAFSCRAVSEGSGVEVRAHEEEWAGLLLEVQAPAPPAIRLAGREVAPSIVLEIERVLIGLLRNASLDPPDRVRGAADFLKLGLMGDPTTPHAAMLRDAIAAGLPARVRREPSVEPMDATQTTVFRQWLYLALNPAPSGDERRWREAGIAFRDAVGRPVVGGFELRASFEDIDRVDASLIRRGCDLPTAWLAAKLVGQRFLLAGVTEAPFIESARMLLLCFPMIAWTSKALAADRSSSRVEEPDVRLAIRAIDRTLGQLSLASFPKPQAKAFHWTIHETDLVTSATRDVLGGRDP